MFSKWNQRLLCNLGHRNASNGRAIIVGGGPCGAATAIALNRQGIECHVFEKVKRNVENAGGSLTIHGGGTCLKYLGLEKPYKDISSPINKIIYTGVEGEHLYTLTNQQIKNAIESNEDENIRSSVDLNLIRGLMRADMYNMLQNECSKSSDESNDNNIYLTNNKEFEKYEKLSNGDIKVWFKDGTNIIGDILLGCDGVNSKVRRQLFLNNNGDDSFDNININPCKYSGYSAWYAVGNVSDIKDELIGSKYIAPDMKQSIINNEGYTINFELNDSSMGFFNVLPKTDKYNFFLGFNNNVINYGMLNDQNETTKSSSSINTNSIINDWDVNTLNDKQRLEMQDFIKKYKFNPFFLECTELNQRMISYDIYTVQTSSQQPWFDDKILLMGDAAHGVTPYGGQGCNHALYDAVALGYLYQIRKANLQKSDEIRNWFELFYNTRNAMTAPMIQGSLKLGEYFQSPVEQHEQRNEMIKKGLIANIMVKSWVPNVGIHDFKLAV